MDKINKMIEKTDIYSRLIEISDMKWEAGKVVG